MRARDLVDPLGPMFVSYRQDDGTAISDALAWTLRAAGVPVWHDIHDLLPGDTTRRLSEALDSGLSGGVLVATANIAKSSVIRDVEVPHLLRLHRKTQFSLTVANTLVGAGGKPDYTAPDELLRRRQPPRGWTRLLSRSPYQLAKVKQYPLLAEDDDTAIAHAVACRRMQHLRRDGATSMQLSVQTRQTPSAAFTARGLAMRTRPPDAGRTPPDDVWRPLCQSLRNLSTLITLSGVRNVRIVGGAHLSIALAIGAALPTTSAHRVIVCDDNGGLWQLPPGSGGRATLDERRPVATAARGADAAVAIMVDVHPQPTPSDAFEQHVKTAGRYRAATALVRRQHLDASTGSQLAADLGHEIRSFAAEHKSNNVHLFVRAPFALTVLLGRTLNTLTSHAYEWDDTTTPQCYREVLVLTPGAGGGPARPASSIVAAPPPWVTP